MVWESIKDFYNARTTTSIGKVSGLLLIIALAIASRYSDNHRNSRRHFVCNTNKPNKSFIEAECFDKYGQEYTDKFPPDAFVILWVILVVALSIYTLFASRHVLVVEHYKNNLSQISQKRRRKMEGSCSVFSLYTIHLVLRAATLVVFTYLQLTLRPRSFPSTYKCPLNPSVECKDDFYKENTNLNWIGVGLSAAIFLSSLMELLLLITKCCWNRRRYNNLQFIYFLLDVDEEEQQEGYQKLCSKLKNKFLTSTETLEELYGKKVKTDTIFTKLLIRTQNRRRIQYYLSFEEGRESLLSYTKDVSTNKVIKQAYQLFMPDEDTEKPKLILLIGRAGIGKTLFSMKLVRDWASGSLFPREEVVNKYKFVFLFFFRQLNEIVKPLSLFDFLNLSHDIDDSEFDFVCKNPEQTLIVMDGLDEFKGKKRVYKLFPRKKKQYITAICAQILNRKVLNGATVVVTTRPERRQLIIRFDRIAEILGFKPKDVEEYFKKFFDCEVEKADIALRHVKENANVAGVCYIPVNCYIICTYFQWHLQNQHSTTEQYKLPSTITELYQGIFEMFTLKHHDRYRGQKFSDTPDITSILPELSRLSFELLQAKKYVFNQNDLKEAVGEEGVTKVLESGIIHSIPGCGTSPFRFETKFCFIHLSFQEFLTAHYLVNDENGCTIMENAIEQKLDIVIQFVSGLLKTESSSDKARKLLSFIVEKLCEGESLSNYLQVIKCIFEFGCPSFAKQVVQQYNFTDLRLRVNDSDCAALAFLLSLDVETKYKTKILNLSGSLITGVGMKYLTNALNSPNCCIEYLDLSDCHLNEESALYLSEALSSGHCTLLSLNVSDNTIGDEGTKYLSEALSSGHCTLQSLDVSRNRIGDEGAKYLSKALSSGHCTLLSLNVSDNRIGDEGTKYLSEALSSGHCTLQSLDVSRNRIGDEGAEDLSEALSSGHCTLRSLSVFDNSICFEYVIFLSEVLSSSHCTVNVPSTGIDAEYLS